MKDILRVPMFALMLLCLAVILCVTLYILVARHPKFGVTLEKIFVGILFFTINGGSGVPWIPFSKLHPKVFYNVETTPPTIIVQIAIYGAMILMLFPRLTKTTQKISFSSH